MTDVVHTEILMSLQTMHGDVQRRVAELDRYRALKAIEQTIADFPDLDDIAHALGDVRDRVQQQLDGTREFRALRSIERILPELSDVLILLGGETHSKRDTAACSPNPGAESLADAGQDGAAMHAPPVDDRDAAPVSQPETTAVDAETVALAEVSEEPEDLAGFAMDTGAGDNPDPAGRETSDDRHPPGSDAGPHASEAAHVPSLADSVAQLMAQAAVPPPRDPPALDWSASQETPVRPQSPADRAA